MTTERIEQIRKRLNEASLGPWQWVDHYHVRGDGSGPSNDPDDCGAIVNFQSYVLWFGSSTQYDQLSGHEPDNCDRDFIVHARNDVSELLDYVEQLRYALTLLHSVQNGSPLPKYDADYADAMRRTRALLNLAI